MDPEVDFTYWVFDIDISKTLTNRFKEVDSLFTQKKYIITNRRIVHVFNSDPHYHASGFHKEPEDIVEVLKSLFMPDEIQFLKNRGPVFYKLKNNENKVKSFLNIQNNKYLKIQTSYLSESIGIIEDLAYVFSDDVQSFGNTINESEEYIMALQDKYLLIDKLLYTYNPNVNFGSPDYHTGSLSLNEEQIPIILKNTEFIENELGCHYLLENDKLTLVLKS
jgi:hypothetical protein